MSIEANVNIAWIKRARKRHYRDRKTASEHAKFISRTIGSKLKPYRCDLCGGWHLYTTKTEKS